MKLDDRALVLTLQPLPFEKTGDVVRIEAAVIRIEKSDLVSFEARAKDKLEECGRQYPRMSKPHLLDVARTQVRNEIREEISRKQALL